MRVDESTATVMRAAGVHFWNDAIPKTETLLPDAANLKARAAIDKRVATRKKLKNRIIDGTNELLRHIPEKQVCSGRSGKFDLREPTQVRLAPGGLAGVLDAISLAGTSATVDVRVSPTARADLAGTREITHRFILLGWDIDGRQFASTFKPC